MKILTQNIDNLVVFAGDITLDVSHASGPGWISHQFSTINATLYDVALPEKFLPGAWSYDGQTWAVTNQTALDEHFAIAIPQSVTMRQARLALLAAGLLPAVDAAIASMPEPDKTAAQITWEFAATVDRGFGMVPQLAAALGMTETQIDALFIAAAAL